MNRETKENEGRHPVTHDAGTGRDMALGAAYAGARAGAAATRVVLAPLRVAARTPIVGSVLQRARARLNSESQAARRQIETTASELLEAPELERTVDRVLAGPLTDSVAHSIGEHHVAERVVAGVLTTADIENSVAATLDDERTRRIVEQVLDSRLTVEVTDRVLRSPELQQLIERIAASPEIRAALTQQTTSLAGEMVGGVRHRTERLDDAAERTVHRWFRRPLPQSPGTAAYGGLLTRAVAFGIDICIAGLIAFVTLGLLSLVGSLVGEERSGRAVGTVTGAGWTLAVGLYLVFFWTVLGQTPAMRLMHLRVTDARGNPPSLGRSVLRLFGLLLAIVPMFAGFLPVLFSRRRKGLQDFIANTTVVSTEDREPA